MYELSLCVQQQLIFLLDVCLQKYTTFSFPDVDDKKVVLKNENLNGLMAQFVVFIFMIFLNYFSG